LEKQYYEILKPAFNQALPSMRINRNFPRAVADGPVGHQGLAISNLFTKQLNTHILTLMRYDNQCRTQQDTSSEQTLKLSIWKMDYRERYFNYH